MTNYSLKTGEVVQVENIAAIYLMTDAEYLEWEASVLGTQQHSPASVPLGQSDGREYTQIED